jgi:hypothetical protein
LPGFQSRVTYLKNHLRALECLPPEKGNLIIVINALKSTYPWHNFLMYDFENKELTWKKLMEDISKRANHELSEMSLMGMKKPQNQSQEQEQPEDSNVRKMINGTDCVSDISTHINGATRASNANDMRMIGGHGATRSRSTIVLVSKDIHTILLQTTQIQITL